MFILPTLLLLLNFCGDGTDSQKVKNSDTSLISESPVVVSEDLITEEMAPSEPIEKEPRLPIAQRTPSVNKDASFIEQRWFRPVVTALILGVFFIGGKLFIDHLAKKIHKAAYRPNPRIQTPESLESTNEIDFYATLGIPKTATSDEIKAAYKKLAWDYHPDRFTDPIEKEIAQEKFKEINIICDLLSTELTRIEYDRFGFAPFKKYFVKK